MRIPGDSRGATRARAHNLKSVPSHLIFRSRMGHELQDPGQAVSLVPAHNSRIQTWDVKDDLTR